MITKKREKQIIKKIESVEQEINLVRAKLKKKIKLIIERNRKINFPKSIEILGEKWSIILSEDLSNESGKLNGLCYKKTKVIMLCLSNENIIRTCLHELQHSIDYETANSFEAMKKENTYFNEIRVSTLAEIWLGIFKQLKGIENGR